MKIYIKTNGDPRVGYDGFCISINYPTLTGWLNSANNPKKERELLRKRLEIFWTTEIDEETYVQFADECPDCGCMLEDSLKRTGRERIFLPCKNKNCLSNFIEG